MIANFFSKTKPINTLAIVALLFLIYLFSTVLNFKGDLTFSFILNSVTYFILLLVTLFTVNFILRKNSLTKDNSYSLLLFVLFLGMFPFSVISFKLVSVNFILLLSYRRIYSLRTQKNTKDKLFDSAFWIGIATLIYPWSILTLFLIYIAAFLFDKWTWRNVIIPLVGFLCPIIIYTTYFLLIDKYDGFDTVLSFNNQLNFDSYNSFKLLIPLAIIISLMLWAIFPTTLKITTVNNEFKSSWQLLITHFFILVFVVLPWPEKNGSELLFLFFPMALILANYLQIVEERWFKEVFLYALLTLTIVVYFL